MQMAVIEAARDLVGIAKAGSTEFGPSEEPVVGLMTEWMRGNELEKRRHGGELGGTMRLGAYVAALAKGSRVAKIYGSKPDLRAPPPPLRGQHPYRARLEEAGVRFCGMSPDGLLPEIIELPDHPWFIGVQFHPELKSARSSRTRCLRSSSCGGGAEPAGVNSLPRSLVGCNGEAWASTNHETRPNGRGRVFLLYRSPLSGLFGKWRCSSIHMSTRRNARPSQLLGS